METYPHPYARTHTHARTRTHTHIALRTHRLQLPIAPYVQEADAGYGDEPLVSPRTRRLGRALYGLVTINLYAPFACRVCSIRLSCMLDSLVVYGRFACLIAITRMPCIEWGT